MSARIAALATAGLAWLLGAAPAHAGGPDLPLPHGARTGEVGEELVADGAPLRIRSFESPQPVGDVLRFYQRHWGDEASVTDLPPWRIVATRLGDAWVTVQLQPAPAGGSRGWIGVRDLARRGAASGVGERIAHPAGSVVWSDLASRDFAKRARTLLVSNERPLRENVSFYRAAMRADDWTLHADGGGVDGHWLAFGRDAETAQIALTERDGVTTAAIVVERPGSGGPR